jgi:hypothetical protein
VLGDTSVRHNAEIRTTKKTLLLCIRRRHFVKMMDLNPASKQAMVKYLERNLEVSSTIQ